MKFAVLVLALCATLGQSRDLASPHIINGEEVEPHSHPHQVALKNGWGEFFCGGSLISDEWVLTAAHCADASYSIRVIAGAHNIYDSREKSQQRVDVLRSTIHPEWDRSTTSNDIAVLHLAGTFRVDGTTVKPIRLPRVSDKDKSFWFWKATMTGWGITSSSSSDKPSKLRGATERVMTNIACKTAFLFRLVEDTNICTSGIRSKGTCHGDSGGPLVVQEDDGINTLVGITSFGLPACDLIWPSVFVRVTSYLDWIHMKTGIPLRP